MNLETQKGSTKEASEGEENERRIDEYMKK